MKLRPIRVYTHHLTGHTIALQGAIHVGPKSYYEHMRDVIFCLEAKGYVIHVEGTHAPRDLDALSERERGWIERMKGITGGVMGGAYLPLADVLGLVTQAELSYEPTWENHDVDLIHMLNGVDDREELFRALEGIADGADALRQVPEWMRSLARWYLANRGVHWMVKTFGKRNNQTIHKYRERVAVAAATSSTLPVLMVWGEGHEKGIGRLLTEAGYVRNKIAEKTL